MQLTIAERLKLPINAIKVAIDAQRERTRGRGSQRQFEIYEEWRDADGAPPEAQRFI